MFKLKIYDQRSMLFNQMKNNKYDRTLQNLIPISQKEAKIDTSNTQIHDHSLSWLGTGNAMTGDRVELMSNMCFVQR